MKTQKNNAQLTRVLTGAAIVGLLVLTASSCVEETVEPSTPWNTVTADQPPVKEHDTFDDQDPGETGDTDSSDELDFVLGSFANYEMSESNCTQNPVGLTVFESYVLTVTEHSAEENAIVIHNFADIGYPIDATLRNHAIVIPVQAFALGDWRYRIRGTGLIGYDGVNFEYILDAVGPDNKETISCRVSGKRL
jgi:hypothetical protein